MNIVVTIPWGAVVGGCSASRARRVPLLIASSCFKRSGGAFDVVEFIERATAEPMAMASRSSSSSSSSSLAELVSAAEGAVAILTGDGESAVLQARMESWAGLVGAARRRGEFARRYVTRYARFEPDAGAFVLPAKGDEQPEFARPAAWGFTATDRGVRWTGDGVFSSPPPVKSHPFKSSPHRSSPDWFRPRFEGEFEEKWVGRGDPLRCLPQLRQIRLACESAEAGTAAAYELALSLGRCRLFGVKVEEDFALGQAAFFAASGQMIEHLKRVARWVMGAGDVCAYLLRNAALEMLEIRMDAHAAYLALDEAYAAARFEGHPRADHMGRRLNQVRRMIDVVDGNLKEQEELLRLAAGTHLLENWRRLLAPCFRGAMPWWVEIGD
jgi:hypothetical protein